MTNPIKDLLKRIKDEDIQYVDVRFTDPRGTLQHVTMINDEVDEDFFENGLMFDGSSIDGWASIEKSDMKLILDATSAYVDPFYAEKTMAVHCHVVEPDTGQTYERCPRATAMRAEAYLKPLALVMSPTGGPRRNSFCLTMCGFPILLTKCLLKWMRMTRLGTPIPNMKWAIWGIALV